VRPSSLSEIRGNCCCLWFAKPSDWEANDGDIDMRMRLGDVMSEKKWQGTTSGLLIGIGVGVGIGILLAPKSGKDTRDQIAGSVKDGLDGAIEKGQSLTRRAQQTLDDARERVQDAAEAGEQAYRDAKSVIS
jgi:gas vesicle protein